MAEVTGPIMTLAGTLYGVPDGTMCDDHPDRPAVKRVQGETDSFGCEMYDFCEECAKRYAKEMREADRSGMCEWCHKHAPALRDRRDYDEGLCGRVYRVCSDCIKRSNDEAEEELRESDYYGDVYDHDDWERDREEAREHRKAQKFSGPKRKARLSPKVTCGACAKPWQPGHQCRRKAMAQFRRALNALA